MNLREATQPIVHSTEMTTTRSQLSSPPHFSLGVDAYGGTLTSIYGDDDTGDTLHTDIETVAMKPSVDP